MNKKQKTLLWRIIIAAVFWVPLFLISEEIIPVELPKWALIILFLIPYLLVGYDILRKAFKGICHGQVFDENFLMTVATLGAFAIGEAPEAVGVMLFYRVGEYFEHRAVERSRSQPGRSVSDQPSGALWFHCQTSASLSLSNSSLSHT